MKLFFENREVGEIEVSDQAEPVFLYDDGWLADVDAFLCRPRCQNRRSVIHGKF